MADTFEWRTSVVAHSCNSKQIETTLYQLGIAGFEDFNVCVPRGIKVPERGDIAVTRMGNIHTSHPYLDYILTLGALETLVSGYLRSADLFMLCRTNMMCWEQIQHYCECQIEPSRFAVYSLHTPRNLTSGEQDKRPEAYNGDGFYRVQTNELLQSADMLVMPPFVAKYLLTVLPKPELNGFTSFAQALGAFAYSMKAFELYYHVRSLAMKTDENLSDFVGVGYVMPNAEIIQPKPLNGL